MLTRSGLGRAVPETSRLSSRICVRASPILPASRGRSACFGEPLQSKHRRIVLSARPLSTLVTPKKLSNDRVTRPCASSKQYCAQRQPFSTKQSRQSRASNNWQPGTEPGVDPNDNEEDCFKEDAHALHQECTITVHDFSPSRLVSHDLNNDTLEAFLAKNPRRSWWAEVRWINVDGISWDVIRILGREKGLHRLAIEDLMNKKNRSKVDWYPDAAFVILSLQRLISLNDVRAKNRLAREQSRKITTLDLSSASPGASKGPPRPMQTLQTLRTPLSSTRQQFLAVHSPLQRSGLTISVEQVALFLLADNTIITFFESAAASTAVTGPLLKRLQSPRTIMRASSDAGLLMQGVLDTVVDLAIPIVNAYEKAIVELEVEVLREPNVAVSKMMYVLSSELQTLKAQIQPIISVIGAIRDHHMSTLIPDTASAAMSTSSRSAQTPSQASLDSTSVPSIPNFTSMSSARRSNSGDTNSPNATNINISRLTHTYLGDVLDHAILLTTSLTTMSTSASNMISLIFNTMSVAQNETMKQLNFVTVVFLPLTFLAGYFGMNFEQFPSLKTSDTYFWYLATPITVVTVVVLLRQEISRRMWRIIWGKRFRRAGSGGGMRGRGRDGMDV